MVNSVAWISGIYHRTYNGYLWNKKPEKGIGIAGLVLSIIGLVICIINSVMGAYMGATGQLF